ncbi:MAG: hypothetical protein L3J39_16155 [Verrucomicrobiales bacterium]|nr:hypothetical protein [Verrucomicrobiales bacterium]
MPMTQYFKHLTVLIAALTTLLPSIAMSQAKDQNGIERSPAEIKRAIAVVEQRLARQNGRVHDLRTELTRLDGRIETEVDQILKTLEKVGDSKDSHTRVAQTKGQVIEGLKKSIVLYQQKRSQVRAELAKHREGLEKSALEGDMKKFDAMSEKRIAQIMELANTLTSHEDYKKYDTYASSNYADWGWGWSNYQEKNPDYVQNKRVTKITDKERKGILEALKKSIADLENQNRALTGRLDSSNFANQKDLIKEDLARNQQAIGRREAQLEGLLTTVATPTAPISRTAAHELELMIRDIADDLKRDFNTLFRRYSEFVKERAQSNALEEQLLMLNKMLE